MAGAIIRILSRAIERKLKAAERRAANARAMFEEIGEIVLVSVQDNFDAGGRPKKWPALKKRQGKPLQDTGRLLNSITKRVTSRSAEVGTNVVYAATHNYGRDHIPQREFMLLQDEDREDIREAIGEYLTKGFK